MNVSGLPLFGFWLPRIGTRKVPFNRDKSVTDTGKFDIADEVGYYYANILSFEWFGFGVTIWQFDDCQLRYWTTDELVWDED